MTTRFISERPFITTDDIVLLASHIETSGEHDLRLALSEIGIDPESFDLQRLANDLWKNFEIVVVI